MNNKNQISRICPACDCEIEVDEHIDKKIVCWYCWYRAQVGTSKFLLFKAMLENGNIFVTPDEAKDLVNKLRKKYGKPEIDRDGVYKILRRYSRYYENAKKRKSHYLVLVRKIKTKHRGRPIHKYRLSARLAKRVEKMEDRWMMGLPINSKVNKGNKFRMSVLYAERVRNISVKIKRGDYPPFKYMIRGTYDD